MAKKLKIFSEILLGLAAALTLGIASSISPVHACEGGEVGTNCVEEADKDAALTTGAQEDIYGEANGTVESERSISHSFFLAGNEITSKDDIKGIHFLAGNLVNFDGSADYGAFAGNSLKVDGKIKNDLFIAGNSIEISENAELGRDLYAAARSVTIKANLKGNAFVGGERVILENTTIDGDLRLAAENIIFNGKVSIKGTFEYNDNAQITGLSNLSAAETKTYVGSSSTEKLSLLTSATAKLLSLLGRLLITIILIAIAAKFSKRLIDEANLKNSWKDIALGLALLIAIPLAAIFVMVTVIGLPLALVGIGFYILFTYLANSVTGLVVGDLIAKKLFKKEKLHIFLKATIGIVLVTLLGFVPYIGGLISGISVCYGFGYLVHKIFRQPKTVKK